MLITKIINAKSNDGAKELQELVKMFGAYCVSSSKELSQEMQSFDCPLKLAEYIDAKQKQGLITDVDEPEHIDCIVDLSHKVEEASLALFDQKEQ